MAEASAGARLDAALVTVRDVMILSSDDGTYSITLSFNPWRFRKQLIHSIFSLKLTLQNSVWPLTPAIWGSVCALTALKVCTAPKDSWWRSGWLANALWSWDSLFPWQNGLPLEVRLVWLSIFAGTFGVIGLSLIQRSILKLLLQYHGYMKLEHGQKMSTSMKIWFLLVKTLSGRKPATYNFQGVLPGLPIPPLKQTVKNYLLSVKPLLSETEFQDMERMSVEFLKRDAWLLQGFLRVRSWFTTSWLWTWWEKYIYLIGRDPIMINSNYYVLDSCWFTITTNQAARAAMLLYQAHKFKRMIDWQQLDPIMIQKVVPMCMKQYERIFDTTRIPGLECDKIVHYTDDPQRYVAVSCRGVWYKLNMTVKGSTGIRPCHLHELESQIAWILEDAAKNPAKSVEDSIAALTGWNRTRWAEARKQFFHEGVNRASLQIIEKAMTVLNLDHRSPKDLDEQSRMIMHGDGTNLWFDKSVSFVAFPNGKAGLMAEHSHADALTVAHMWEWVTTGERSTKYTADGHTPGWNDPKAQDPKVVLAHQRPPRLKWDLAPKALEVIKNAIDDNKKLIDDLDLCVIEFKDFGKGFMKKAKISPDAFAQLAMQLAYKRDSGGKRALTYEASVTRLYAKGRTETVRSLSVESAAFVDAMMDPKVTNDVREKAIRQAADKHTSLYKSAMVGQGVDRHLFGLYVASKYFQTVFDFFHLSFAPKAEFLQAALKIPWTLSTSQTPQKQTEGRWFPETNPDDANKVSPGGGFGPVAENGYGVSYQFANEEVLFFHVSSKKHSPATDSKRFGNHIRQAMLDIKAMFDDTMKAKAADASKSKTVESSKTK